MRQAHRWMYRLGILFYYHKVKVERVRRDSVSSQYVEMETAWRKNLLCDFYWLLRGDATGCELLCALRIDWWAMSPIRT